MILYFSGTGNSRWVAGLLATILGETTMDMAGCLRTGSIPRQCLGAESIGVVFPVHSWMPPLPVLRYLSHLSRSVGGAYRYAVCTCGDDAGKAMTFLNRRFALDAAWSVAMPNTYVPLFQLDSDELAAAKIEAARRQIPGIAQAVAERRRVWQVHEGSCPWLKSRIINPLFHRFMVRSTGFHTDEGCTSCGACVRQCPMNNIRLVEGRPVWGSECIHCMACLHGCPAGVVQYGKHTQKKGRYCLEHYLR